MAGTPRYKIFRESEYVASCKYLEDAAAFVALLGEGASVRLGHAAADTIWREGSEYQSAGESYDAAAEVMRLRIRNLTIPA